MKICPELMVNRIELCIFNEFDIGSAKLINMAIADATTNPVNPYLIYIYIYLADKLVYVF